MKLYVMRHGPAEDYSASGRDGDRALTPSGSERVRSVARLLADEGEAPLLIVTSPLVRALQTAEIVAATTGLRDRGGAIEVRPEMEPGGPAARLTLALAKKAARGVMVVGHEPDLSRLVGRLLGSPMKVSMTKAMVVGLFLGDAPSGAGRSDPDGDVACRLRFILDPKTLTLDADARDADGEPARS